MIVLAIALTLIVGGAIALGWITGDGRRRPDPAARPLTVDAVTAAAALIPDAPLFTDDQLALLHADEIGAQAEAWLATETQEH